MDEIKEDLRQAQLALGPQATSQAPGVLPGRRPLVDYDGRGFPIFLEPTEDATYDGYGSEELPGVATAETLLDSLMRKSAQAAVAAGCRPALPVIQEWE